jgi:hypothetical protein
LPRPEAIFNLSFEVEHILPQASGGESSPDNLARFCRSCNLHKSDAVAAFDEETQSTVRFLHPCRDAWREHFAVNAETGKIEGLTDIGRMTVLRLRINSAFKSRLEGNGSNWALSASRTHSVFVCEMCAESSKLTQTR